MNASNLIEWVAVAPSNKFLPGLGVGALVNGQQVAVFRRRDGSLSAISNYCPLGEANVLSRGLLGSLQGKSVVASPLYKHHFCLETGVCVEDPSVSVPVYAVREHDGIVEIGI